MTDDTRELAGRRLLVVDDSAPMTRLLHDVFAACGADVLIANSGRDALVRIQLEGVDVLVLDLVMPDISGWDVLAFVRDHCPHLLSRTIVLTGDRYGRDTCTALAGLPVHVLFKPFDVRDLRAAARELLHRGDANGTGRLGKCG